MTLGEKLCKIQQEMKSPKKLWNKFGKYAYRSAENILETFKPFEEKHKVYMIVSDTVVAIGNSVYIEATATLYDCESNASISTKAYAREPSSKKGMDESQITGASSSYARKYALNGLFLLDDSKDADSSEAFIESEETTKEKLLAEFEDEIKRTGKSLKYFLNTAGANKVDELEPDFLQLAISQLRAFPDKKR